jgi:hypothetical protein
MYLYYAEKVGIYKSNNAENNLWENNQVLHAVFFWYNRDFEKQLQTNNKCMHFLVMRNLGRKKCICHNWKILFQDPEKILLIVRHLLKRLWLNYLSLIWIQSNSLGHNYQDQIIRTGHFQYKTHETIVPCSFSLLILNYKILLSINILRL